eukprot:jgi/Mesvir1/10663/Mv13752-RA.1
MTTLADKKLKLSGHTSAIAPSDPASQQRNILRLAFVALGTRGDVQPLAVVASNLRQALLTQEGPWDVLITFVTHEAHQTWLEPWLRSHAIRWSGLSSLPAGRWHARGRDDVAGARCQGAVGHAPQGGTHASIQEINQGALEHPQAGGRGGQVLENDHRMLSRADHGVDGQGERRVGVENMVAFEKPGTSKKLNLASGKAPASEWEDREEILQACLRAFGARGGSDACVGGACLVVFNLFALEAWHLAEYLRIPCVALSPCLVPYSAPSRLESSFRREHPALYARLKRARDGKEVCWADIEHWMWPLFGERWGPWRQRRLGLPACPFTSQSGTRKEAHNLPATVLPLCLPPPTRLLYGLSPSLVDRPGYWPSAVTVCGYWLPDCTQEGWLEKQGTAASAERVPAGDKGPGMARVLGHALGQGHRLERGVGPGGSGRPVGTLGKPCQVAEGEPAMSPPDTSSMGMDQQAAAVAVQAHPCQVDGLSKEQTLVPLSPTMPASQEDSGVACQSGSGRKRKQGHPRHSPLLEGPPLEVERPSKRVGPKSTLAMAVGGRECGAEPGPGILGRGGGDEPPVPHGAGGGEEVGGREEGGKGEARAQGEAEGQDEEDKRRKGEVRSCKEHAGERQVEERRQEGGGEEEDRRGEEEAEHGEVGDGLRSCGRSLPWGLLEFILACPYVDERGVEVGKFGTVEGQRGGWARVDEPGRRVVGQAGQGDGDDGRHPGCVQTEGPARGFGSTEEGSLRDGRVTDAKQRRDKGGTAGVTNSKPVGEALRRRRLVYIGFGSMPSMGLIADPDRLVTVVASALSSLGLRGIIHTTGSPALAQAVATWRQQDQQGPQGAEGAVAAPRGCHVRGSELPQCQARTGGVNEEARIPAAELRESEDSWAHRSRSHIFGLEESVALCCLLSHCCAAIHHGASGTVAACITAGIPQIACPFIFDQFMWADKLSWVGVAPPPLDPRKLMHPSSQAGGEDGDDGDEMGDTAEPSLAGVVAEVACRLKTALSSPGMRRSVEDLSRAVRLEDGVRVAVSSLLQMVAAQQVSLREKAAPRAREDCGSHASMPRDEADSAPLAPQGCTPQVGHPTSQGGEDGAEGRRHPSHHHQQPGTGHAGDGVDDVSASGGVVSGCRRCERQGELAGREEDVTLLELPNGDAVWTSSPSEAMHIYNEIFVQDAYLGTFRQLEGDAFLRPTTSGALVTVLDVGANVGLFCLRLQQAHAELSAKGGGAPPVEMRVVAVEALPPNVTLLRRNLLAWALPLAGFSVAITPVGVWRGSSQGQVSTNTDRGDQGPHASRTMPSAGATAQAQTLAGGSLPCSNAAADASIADSLPFTYYPHMPGNSTAYPLEKLQLQGHRQHPHFYHQARQITCPMRTISQVLEESNIETVDLLKVDVECMELDALQGIDGRHWGRIQRVVVEVHDVDGRLAAVTGLLSKHGLCTQTASLPGVPPGTFMVFAYRQPPKNC